MKSPGGAPQIAQPTSRESKKRPASKERGSDIAREANELAQRAFDMLDADNDNIPDTGKRTLNAPNTREMILIEKNNIEKYKNRTKMASSSLARLREIVTRIENIHANANKNPTEIRTKIEPLRSKFHEDASRENNRLSYEAQMQELRQTQEMLRQAEVDATFKDNPKEIKTVKEAEAALREVKRETLHSEEGSPEDWEAIEEKSKKIPPLHTEEGLMIDDEKKPEGENETELLLAKLNEQYKAKAAEAKNKTPEEIEREAMEKLAKDIEECANGRGKAIDHNIEAMLPEHKNWFGRVAQKYRDTPRWGKVLIGGTLWGAGAISIVALGPTSPAAYFFFLAGRGFASAGTYVWVEAATERWKIRTLAGFAQGAAATAAFIGAPNILQYASGLNIGSTLEQLGFKKSSIPWLKNPSSIPGVGPLLETSIFSKSITVTEGDRLRGLWGILEKKLTNANIIDAATSAQKKNYMIDYLEKKLQSLSPEELNKLGFKSSNINTIRAGEKLNLSILEKRGWLQAVR